LKQNKNNKTISAIITVIFIIGFIYAALNGINPEEKKTQNPTSKPDTKQGVQTESTKNSNTAVTGELKVSFIDVGQADSVLLQQGDKFMLIDAGNNGDVQTVKDYLTSQGVKELQYFIGTHKDEDHIGGADGVINSFKVGKVYFPKQIATTQTYKDFVTAVKNKGLSLTVPKVGDQFKLGEAAVTVLAPNSSEYEDSNDYSIVVKVTFGSTTFLLTGDAEALSEKELVASGKDLSATVLKVGHHGSLTSTSQAFLDKVNPKFAVISAGAGNKYGHPAQETMDKLKAKGVQVFRTDEQKTIIATSNGKEINFNVKPGSYKGITK
jgi:competence protein ComEC